MNCKQGDLAVIVRPVRPENLGVIVEVVAPAFSGEGLHGLRYEPSHQGPYWKVRGRITTRLGIMDEWFCSDIQLRPIRPSEGADETLTWKEVPSGVTA